METQEEIIQLIDDAIKDMSVDGAVNFVEELVAHLESVLAGLQNDKEDEDD